MGLKVSCVNQLKFYVGFKKYIFYLFYSCLFVVLMKYQHSHCLNNFKNFYFCILNAIFNYLFIGPKCSNGKVSEREI